MLHCLCLAGSENDDAGETRSFTRFTRGDALNIYI
jgi:hypothetical protein